MNFQFREHKKYMFHFLIREHCSRNCKWGFTLRGKYRNREHRFSISEQWILLFIYIFIYLFIYFILYWFIFFIYLFIYLFIYFFTYGLPNFFLQLNCKCFIPKHNSLSVLWDCISYLDWPFHVLVHPFHVLVHPAIHLRWNVLRK